MMIGEDSIQVLVLDSQPILLEKKCETPSKQCDFLLSLHESISPAVGEAMSRVENGWENRLTTFGSACLVPERESQPGK
jgi:hypothetical protein